MNETTSTMASKALRLSNEIKPMLAGKGPDIQGAVLADLVSIYFAGHPEFIREKVIRMWMETMRELIPAIEQEISERRAAR